MALIPSKSKTSIFSAETLNVGTMMLLLGLLIISSNLIDSVVHESLRIIAIPSVILIAVFLLFPNESNKGKNGAQRILLCFKFYMKKMKGYVYK